MKKKIVLMTIGNMSPEDALAQILRKRGTFTLPQLGTITLVHKPKRRHWDGIHKKMVTIDGRYAVKFKVAPSFVARFNKSSK